MSAESGEVYRLKHAIPYGSEIISELKLKPCGRAFKDFKQEVSPDGTIVYAPYPLALIAIRMANQPDPVVDLLHPADMNALAQVALHFLGSGLAIGKTP